VLLNSLPALIVCRAPQCIADHCVPSPDIYDLDRNLLHAPQHRLARTAACWSFVVSIVCPPGTASRILSATQKAPKPHFCLHDSSERIKRVQLTIHYTNTHIAILWTSGRGSYMRTRAREPAKAKINQAHSDLAWLRRRAREHPPGALLRPIEASRATPPRPS